MFWQNYPKKKKRAEKKKLRSKGLCLQGFENRADAKPLSRHLSRLIWMVEK
jgi:hypothetical protein